MIKPCSSPDCRTLTYGEVCLGCLQRKARERQQAVEYAQAQPCDHGSPADSS